MKSLLHEIPMIIILNPQELVPSTRRLGSEHCVPRRPHVWRNGTGELTEVSWNRGPLKHKCLVCPKWRFPWPWGYPKCLVFLRENAWKCHSNGWFGGCPPISGNLQVSISQLFYNHVSYRLYIWRFHDVNDFHGGSPDSSSISKDGIFNERFTIPAISPGMWLHGMERFSEATDEISDIRHGAR